MEFHNRMYELRKQKGLSQEELAGRINVTRQTISKWEVGESTPDMEKLIALGDLFEISLDELVKGESAVGREKGNDGPKFLAALKEQILTADNKKKAVKGLKIAGIILGIVFVIDLSAMIIYFLLYGMPK